MNKIWPLPAGDAKASPAKRPFSWESGYQNSPTRKKKTSQTETSKETLPDEESLKQVCRSSANSNQVFQTWLTNNAS